MRIAPNTSSSGPTSLEGILWYGIAFVALLSVGGWLQDREPIAGLLTMLWVVLLAPLLLFVFVRKHSWTRTFLLRRPSRRALLAGVVLGASTWLVVAAVNTWLARAILPPPPELFEEMTRVFPRPESLSAWVWCLFVGAFSPAICEEALFRGFLFSSFRARLPAWAVIVVTSVLFGLFHLSIYRFFGATALGLVMGLLVYTSASIWPAVVFHAVNNTAVLVAAHLFFGGESHVPVWQVLLGLAGLFVGLGVVVLGVRQRTDAPSATD